MKPYTPSVSGFRLRSSVLVIDAASANFYAGQGTRAAMPPEQRRVTSGR